MANVSRTGLARQAAYGTAVTSFTPVKLTDIGSTELEIAKIENDEIFGGLDTFAPENGLRSASISFSGRAYPDALGYFLNMIAGTPVTVPAGLGFEHTFVPSDALPPRYTIGMDEPNGIDAYFRDVLLSNFTLSQEVGDVLTFSIDGIASQRVVTPVTVGATGLETRAFRYSDFTAEVDESEYVNFKSVSISVDNPVENIFTLNGEDVAITQEYTGRRSVTIDGTLRFENDAESLRAEFETNAVVDLLFEWEIDAVRSLQVHLPNVRILSHEWSRGFDETTLDISGAAYFDEDLTGSIEFVLVNGIEELEPEAPTE